MGGNIHSIRPLESQLRTEIDTPRVTEATHSAL